MAAAQIKVIDKGAGAGAQAPGGLGASAAPGAQPGARRRRRRIPLALLIVVAVGLVLAAAALTYVLSGSLAGRPPAAEPRAKSAAPRAAAAGSGADPSGTGRKVGAFFSLSTFIVNVAGTGAQRFLKTSITVEVAPGQVPDEVTAKEPVLRDRINDILSSKTLAELEGSSSHSRLRQEIRDCLNSILSETEVVAVYLVEFVLQ